MFKTPRVSFWLLLAVTAFFAIGRATFTTNMAGLLLQLLGALLVSIVLFVSGIALLVRSGQIKTADDFTTALGSVWCGPALCAGILLGAFIAGRLSELF